MSTTSGVARSFIGAIKLVIINVIFLCIQKASKSVFTASPLIERILNNIVKGPDSPEIRQIIPKSTTWSLEVLIELAQKNTRAVLKEFVRIA